MAEDTLTTQVRLLESRMDAGDKRVDGLEDKVDTVAKVSVPIARLEEKVGILTKLVVAQLAAIIGLAGFILRQGI